MCRPACLVITVMLFDIGNLISSFGVVDYNDDCEFEVTDHSTFQSRYDESKFCDTRRGLYCVPGLGKCGCFVPHTIYRTGKCRAKVGNTCMGPGNVRLDCVENARCTNNNTAISTFKCQCTRGYLSNAMKTSCFSTDVGYSNWVRGRDRYGNPYWRGAAHNITPHTFSFMGLLIVSVVVVKMFIC